MKKSIELTIQSKALLQKGLFDSADLLLSTAIELDPNNYTAYNNRAFLKFKKDYPSDEVIADYKRSLAIKPDYDMALFSLANYYHYVRDYKNAINAATLLIELPDKTEVTSTDIQHLYVIRGESYKYMQNYGKAISDLQRALHMNPNDEGAYKELGDCYYYITKNLGLAIEQYTKAISIDSLYYQAFLGRAQCYENNTPPAIEAAKADYKRALEIKPDLEDIYNTKSPLLFNTRKELHR